MEPQRNREGPQLFYRLGLTREQDLYRNYLGTYHGIAIRANYLAYFQKFTISLLLDIKKPFFIDPVSYIFAREPKQVLNSKGVLKKSYEKLASFYGQPIEGGAGERSVELGDFSDPDVRQGFAERVIGYQTEQSLVLPDKYSRYQRFVGTELLQPSVILPPYFYMDNTDDGWLELNLDLAVRAIEISEGPVYPVIFISRQLARQSGKVGEIVERYSQLEFGGYFLWIENLSGVYSNDVAIGGYRNFVTTIASLGRPIYSMYGDYFSVLLWHEGLSGYCSGICYGERKEVDPSIVAGEIPDRYYVPRLRSKYQIQPTLERFELSRFPDLGCDCGICPGDMNILELDTEATQVHFMLTRAREIEEIASRSQSDILDELAAAYEEFGDNPLIKVNHLSKWIDILS